MDWLDTDGDGWLETAFGDANADGYFDVLMIDPNADGSADGYAYDTDFNGVYDIFSTEVATDLPAWDPTWNAAELGPITPVLDAVWTLPSPW